MFVYREQELIQNTSIPKKGVSVLQKKMLLSIAKRFVFTYSTFINCSLCAKNSV